jgi:hypothetical protein
VTLFESRRRPRVERLLKEFRALLILTKRIQPRDKSIIDGLVSGVNTMSTKVASLSFLVKTVEEAEANRPLSLYLNKHALETRFFKRPMAAQIQWALLPPHARIGYDVTVSEVTAGRLEWRLLEASLFEDMAMLWNEPGGLSQWTGDRCAVHAQRPHQEREGTANRE